MFGATYFIEQLLVNPSAVTTPILQPGSGSSLLQPSQLIQPFANAVQSDVILSLWLNTASTVLYFSTYQGAVYRLPLPLSGYNSLPAPLVVQATSWWEGVVVDTTETNLYLLDSYNPSIYSFQSRELDSDSAVHVPQ